MQLNKIKTSLYTLFQNLKGNLTGTFFMILLVAFAFASGSLYTKVIYLEKGIVPTKNNDNAPVAGNTDTNAPAVQPKITLDKPNSKDHIRGSKTAQIALIDYSDLSCPYCKRFNETLKQVLTQYDGKVQLVYRHFPLPSLHPYAEKQAEASECVFKLAGDAKFWTYTDQIYAATNEVTVDVLKKMAADLGVDKAKFNSCLDNGDTKSIVDADIQSGMKAGVNGTPGDFLMNLKTGDYSKLGGAVPFESLKQSIDAMLAQ